MTGAGIFKGPTALGTALGAVGASCTADNVALIKQIQSYLKTHGAPNLKVDGQWQGCTASAFRKVFGRPYVTNDDIKLMTGQSCSSDDLIGNISLAYTIPGINTCTDGSDGVSVPGGGATPTQECPAGQVWNDFLKTCVIDIFGQNKTDPTAQQQQCPSGQTWFEALKMCVPTFGTATQGGGTQGTYLLPGEIAPSECMSGNYKNPLTGKCTGPQGIEIAPTECPSGYMKNPLTGNCIPQIGGGAQPQGGACPAGQMNVPLLGCLANPFATQQPGTTQPGTGTDPNSIIGGLINGIASIFGGGSQPVNCPPGSVYSPVSKACVSAGGTTPAIQDPAKTSDGVFGSTGLMVAGVLAVGAAAFGYHVYKKRQEEAEMLAMMGDDPLAGLSDEEALAMAGGDMFGGDMFGGDYMDAYANRKRRGRKSRRRHRRSRR